MITGPHTNTWRSRHPKAFRRILEASIIFFALLGASIALWPQEADSELGPVVAQIVAPAPEVDSDGKGAENAPQGQITPSAASTVATKAFPKALKAHVTAFSDHECGSAWCNRHEPKDGQIAVNYKTVGKVCQIYIPAYDKTYRVVGNTDGKTDADIWFGSDYESALAFGSKTLLINPIPCT